MTIIQLGLKYHNCGFLAMIDIVHYCPNVQVCEYAMEMYSDVPLLQRRKLLEVWVKCKVLLQQSIPTKTYGIGEVSILCIGLFFNDSIV